MPQRFNSRARPYAFESRRWKSIFDAVAAEAASADRERCVLAGRFLRELGGENSSRLVLGGLLADLSAEHYSWVASGDERYPDATTVHERADAFLERLRTLFDDAMILTLPDTYTGVALQFLKKSSYYPIGTSVLSVGIWGLEQRCDCSCSHTSGARPRACRRGQHEGVHEGLQARPFLAQSLYGVSPAVPSG